jgi:hypothetical protein
VIDLSLSSDEEDLITATSRDFEFVQRLFAELNHAILGPPGDGKVIFLDDSDEEKEVQEEKTIDTEPVATSAAVNPASTAPLTPMMLLRRQKIITVMIRGPIRRLAAATAVEVAPVNLRLPC